MKKKTIKIKCKGADLLPYDSLIQFQGDLKTLSNANLEKLKTRIVKRGFRMPFYIWVNNEQNKILDGSQRDKALKSLKNEGYEIPLLPVVYIEAESEIDARETILGISSQYGEWNKTELDAWLENIDSEIKDTLRFVDKEIDILLKEETEDDDEINDIEYNGIIKTGDLLELNKHKIICGEFPKDNTFKEIDLILTDPPYGINIVSRTIGGDKKNTIDPERKRIGYEFKVKASVYKPIINDDKPFNPKELLKICKNIIIFGANYFADKLPISPGWMVWDKNAGREWKDTFADAELIYTSSKKHTQIYRVLWKGMVKVESGKRIHPTQKPIKLIEILLNDFSKENDKIIDPFLGSGSTIIACEKTDRICYGMEIDPYYCDLMVNRYIDWCKKNEIKTTIKLNGKLYEPEKNN